VISSTRKERAKMSKVVNIGVIIRNEQGDTFPVALNPQMVGVIQNLLMQIPVSNSKIVGADGKQVASKSSIPIIPREISFDWEAAYSPMDRDVELELMKKLTEKYHAMGEDEKIDGNIEKLYPDKPAIGEDPENPFNLELKATGRTNAGQDEKTNEELIQEAHYPEKISDQEDEQKQEAIPEQRQDVIIKPPALPLSGAILTPGEKT
jgi:hypothetical protein